MVSEESISSCPICKKFFESPRILPCAESVCINCINEYAKEKHLKCFFCHETHTIPTLGFPINKSLLKILNSIDTNIYRGAVCEDFKSHLKNVEDLVDFLECDLECGKSKIHLYCDGLRNQIDINIDQQIKLLNDTRDELFDELHLYEKECLNNLNQNHDQLESFNQSIQDDKSQLEDDKNYLKKTKISEDILKDKISRVRATEWKLQSKKKKLKNFLFNNSRLFYQTVELCRMPQLVRRNIQELDLKTYEEIDLSDITDVKSKRDINIFQLSNKNFVWEYSKKNYRILEVRDFQNIYSFHKRVKRPLSDSSSKSFSFLRINQNKILLYELGKEIRSFVVFDENLNVKISKQVPHGFVDIITTDSKIFALLSNRNSLIVYDWNLNELMKIFPKSNFFYFTNSILEFQENKEFIFVRSEDSLSMISKKTEEIVQKISLNKDVFINGINTFNLFVSLDKMNKLDVLDFNGQVISSILLKNFPKNEVTFLIDVNQNIICLDPIRLKLYLPKGYTY